MLVCLYMNMSTGKVQPDLEHDCIQHTYFYSGWDNQLYL